MNIHGLAASAALVLGLALATPAAAIPATDIWSFTSGGSAAIPTNPSTSTQVGSSDFLSNHGKTLTVSALAFNGNGSAFSPASLDRNASGLGMCTAMSASGCTDNLQLDSNSGSAGGFGANTEVLRIKLPNNSWIPVSITIGEWNTAQDGIKIFGGNTDVFSQATLIATVHHAANDPSLFTFQLNASQAFGDIFIENVDSANNDFVRIAGFAGAQVPEPMSLVLLSSSLLGLGLLRYRR